MCGIAGILSFDGRPVAERELRRMTDLLAHRGPDGEGFHCDREIGLGHRRLAILDVSDAGRQPMSFGDGRYWICYNGEVYNFVELRRELETRGYRFATSTDTEVVLAAWDAWGPDCLHRFNGMWAFALWDSRERELFLARDRFGVKPLFFCKTPDRFAFASEMKALLPVAGITPEPDLLVVRDIMSGGTPDRGRQTAFKGICRVSAGHRMRIVARGPIREEQWWDTWSSRVDVPPTDEEQVERFRELFDEACRIRLRSDVPVGTLLSGGLDSSSIVSTLARHRGDPAWTGQGERLAPDWQRTFTAEYPGLSADEGEYPGMVLEAARLEGVRVRPRVEDAETMLRHMVEHQDTPIDQSLYAVHSVYRAVAEHGVRVTLDGQGADEALSGYEAMTAAQQYLLSGNLAEAWRAAGAQAALASAHGSRSRVLRTVAVAAARRRAPLLSWLRRAAGRPPRPAPQPRSGLPGPELLALKDERPEWHPPMDAGLLDRDLYDQFHRRTLPGILRKFDHAAMAYSVESRMPFLDWRLVTYCFSLPIRQKVDGGYTKAILRKAMRGIVPQPVLERRQKHGFPIPVEWLATPSLKELIRAVTHEQDFDHLPYWHAPRLRTWFEERSLRQWAGRDLHDMFTVLGTYFWHQRFFGSRAAADLSGRRRQCKG